MFLWHKGDKFTHQKLWLARLIPRRVLYWCVIQAWAYATTERYTDKTPDEVTWDMVCKHLEGKTA